MSAEEDLPPPQNPIDALFRSFIRDAQYRKRQLEQTGEERTVEPSEETPQAPITPEEAEALIEQVLGTPIDEIEDELLEPFEAWADGEIPLEQAVTQVEGLAGGSLAALAVASVLIEVLGVTQVEAHEQILALLGGGLALDQFLGVRSDVVLEEGVGPQLEADVNQQFRKQFADLADAVEVQRDARNRQVSGDASQVEKAEAVRQALGENDVDYLSELGTYGIRPEDVPILEVAALEAPQPEELFEELPQFGVIPSEEAVRLTLELSGFPQPVIEDFQRLSEAIPKSADMWEQQTRAEELVAQLDQLANDAELPTQDLVDRLPDLPDPVVEELRARFAALRDLPPGPPTGSDVESAFTRGLISLDRYLQLIGRLEVNPERYPFVPHEAILSELDGDLRTAVGLGLISEGQYTEYARLAGLDEAAVDSLLAGQDLDEIAQQNLAQQRQQGTLPVDVVTGIGEARSATLEAAEISTVSQLAQASVDQVVSLLDVSESTAEAFISQAQQFAG